MSNPNGIGEDNACLQHGRIQYAMSGSTAVAIAANSTGGLTLNSKVIQTEPFAAQSAAASTWVASSPITIPDGVTSASFYINLGRGNTTAISGTGTEFRVEASAKTSGSDSWMPLTTWNAATAAAMSCAASATGGVLGSTALVILSGTAGVIGDQLCFTTGTIEWSRVAATAGTASITVLDAFTYSHVSATGIVGGASSTSLIVNCTGIPRLRVVVNNNYPTTSQPIFFRAGCVLGYGA